MVTGWVTLEREVLTRRPSECDLLGRVTAASPVRIGSLEWALTPHGFYKRGHLDTDVHTAGRLCEGRGMARRAEPRSSLLGQWAPRAGRGAPGARRGTLDPWGWERGPRSWERGPRGWERGPGPPELGEGPPELGEGPQTPGAGRGAPGPLRLGEGPPELGEGSLELGEGPRTP